MTLSTPKDCGFDAVPSRGRYLGGEFCSGSGRALEATDGSFSPRCCCCCCCFSLSLFLWPGAWFLLTLKTTSRWPQVTGPASPTSVSAYTRGGESGFWLRPGGWGRAWINCQFLGSLNDTWLGWKTPAKGLQSSGMAREAAIAFKGVGTGAPVCPRPIPVSLGGCGWWGLNNA